MPVPVLLTPALPFAAESFVGAVGVLGALPPACEEGLLPGGAAFAASVALGAEAEPRARALPTRCVLRCGRRRCGRRRLRLLRRERRAVGRLRAAAARRGVCDRRSSAGRANRSTVELQRHIRNGQRPPRRRRAALPWLRPRGRRPRGRSCCERRGRLRLCAVRRPCGRSCAPGFGGTAVTVAATASTTAFTAAPPVSSDLIAASTEPRFRPRPTLRFSFFGSAGCSSAPASERRARKMSVSTAACDSSSSSRSRGTRGPATRAAGSRAAGSPASTRAHPRGRSVQLRSRAGARAQLPGAPRSCSVPRAASAAPTTTVVPSRRSARSCRATPARPRERCRASGRGTRSGTSSGRRPPPPRASAADGGSTRRSAGRTAGRADASFSR